ncbi:DUF2798 domain-containing protein [Aliiruegeria sabulilitoris]|uniref:DUF2798 domain-containing protein n=1 Tax=Aliiruegeria sabulilitoris TaxID=1510458 RepID=UPI00082F73C1|nr:DUF2798 domain-containing protein [Aliiruegeria sabulilitoris]NDR59685.1 DUF2798 domain-containing protein [Pseudoruegeria sp. M32A2M]
MIPKRFEPYAFAATLSCMMSFIISGVSTYRALGLIDGFFGIWISSWFTAWAIAFPVVTVVAPLARRFVSRLVAQETDPAI